MPYPRGRAPVGGGVVPTVLPFQVLRLPNTGGVIDAPLTDDGTMFISGTVDADGWHTIQMEANVSRQTPRFGAIWEISQLVDYEGNPIATCDASLQDEMLLVQLRNPVNGCGAWITLSNGNDMTTGRHIGCAAQGDGPNAVWMEGHRGNQRYRSSPVTGARMASVIISPSTNAGDIINQGAWSHDAVGERGRGYSAAASLSGYEAQDRFMLGILSDGGGGVNETLECRWLVFLNGAGQNVIPRIPSP